MGEGGRGRLDPSAVARSTARTPSRARRALAAPVQKFCLSSYVRNGSYAIDDEGIWTFLTFWTVHGCSCSTLCTYNFINPLAVLKI